MTEVLEMMLLLTNIAGLIVLAYIAFYLRKLCEELPGMRNTVVVVQQQSEVKAILDATVLTGGAVKFESEEIGSVIVDFDGRGPFCKMPGEELVVTFQRRRR